MDRLWAPWRISYIKSKKTKDCIFCRAKANEHVIFKTRYSICMLNIYPYNNGHLLICPVRHIAQIESLSPQEAMDIFASLKRAKKILKTVLKPQGYNLGFNLGRAAGAGIAGHLHLHLVPRWRGDTNFMPVTGSTRVISQSLTELLKLLKNADK